MRALIFEWFQEDVQSVIHFFSVEKKFCAEIHQILTHPYGADAMDI